MVPRKNSIILRHLAVGRNLFLGIRATEHPVWNIFARLSRHRKLAPGCADWPATTRGRRSTSQCAPPLHGHQQMQARIALDLAGVGHPCLPSLSCDGSYDPELVSSVSRGRAHRQTIKSQSLDGVVSAARIRLSTSKPSNFRSLGNSVAGDVRIVSDPTNNIARIQ